LYLTALIFNATSIMKQSLFLLLLCVNLSFTVNDKAYKNLHDFNGIWIPVRQAIGGEELPAAGFEKNRLIILDRNYTYTAESVDKGTLKFNGDKLDIYGKEGVNKGRHFPTIYKYENGLLTICYNLAGENYPESFETAGKASLFIAVFKKENGE